MERRHISALNLGFFAQLALLEQSHRGDVSFSLLDYWRTTVLHLDSASIVSCRAASASFHFLSQLCLPFTEQEQKRCFRLYAGTSHLSDGFTDYIIEFSD